MYHCRKRFFLMALLIAIIVTLPFPFQTVNAAPARQTIDPPYSDYVIAGILKDASASGHSIEHQVVLAKVDVAGLDGLIDYYEEEVFEGKIAILKYIDNQWYVFTTYNPEFDTQLQQLPEELLSNKNKAFFYVQFGTAPSDIISAEAFTGHKLPWEGGVPRLVTQTPTDHTGLGDWAYDFSMNVGTPLWASRSGTVALVKENSSSGACDSSFANMANYVVINNDGDNSATLYLHLNTNGVTVSVGQHVNQGDLVAYSGQTGYSCGAHLHFQVQDRGSWWTQSHQVIFDSPIGEPSKGSTVVSNNYRTPITANCSNPTATDVYVCNPSLTPAYTGSTCTSYWYKFNGYENTPAYVTLNAQDSSTSSNSAIWRPNLQSTGTYEIYAYIASHGNIDRNCGWTADMVSIDTNHAKYRVYSSGSTLIREVNVDQLPYSNQWVSLGQFNLSAGTSAYVKLADVTGETRITHNVSFNTLRFKLITATCYQLNTALSPQNGGTISLSQYSSGSCPSGSYETGTQITATANAASGYEFANWSGESTSSSNSISITMNGNRSVTANFSSAAFNTNWMPDNIFTGETDASIGQIRAFLKQQGSCLADEIEDTDGQVIDVPALIHQYAAQYHINPKVLLATMQKEQSAISSCPTTSKLNILMGIGSTPTARNQIATAASLYRAYLNEQEAGGATRSGWAIGVSKETQDGVIVTPASKAIAALFTYTPYAGIQWGGNVAGVGGTYLFKSVWDMYNFDQPFAVYTCYSLIVSKNPEAGGSVSISPGPSIDCASGYEPDTTVQLNASPVYGYKFNNWTGEVSSASASVSVIMNANKQIVANFEVGNIDNPVPALLGINPSSAVAGNDDLTITLNGSGFVNNSVVRFNGTNLTTTYVSSATLTALVPADNLAIASMVSLTVFNPSPGGGTSNSLSFSVTNPVPVLVSVSPSTIDIQGGAALLTFVGSGFLTNSKVLVDGVEISVNYVNASTLTATLPVQSAAGTLSVSVINPAPGGGASAVKMIAVQNPVPVPTSLVPHSVYSGTNGFTLVVYGSKFMPGAVIRWNGVDLVTNRISSYTLQAHVSADLLTTAENVGVTVFNSAPGGGESDAQVFSILNLVPALQSISPNVLLAESDSLTLSVTGAKFMEGSMVMWDSTPLLTTFINATSLTAQVDSSLLSVSGIVPIKVSNPEPGGGASNSVSVQVRNPVPSLDSVYPEHIKAGSGDFTLTVNGTGFVGSAVVHWNGVSLATTKLSSGQLSAVVPAPLVANPGMASINIFQPSPGGGISRLLLFPVQPAIGSDCTPAISVSSSIVDKRSNYGAGSTDSIDNYGITSWKESGPEFVYAYTPSISAKTNAFLTSSSQLNLFLLDGASGVCNSGEVIAYAKKDLSFDAEAGHTYYLVVDGYLGAKALYTLSIDDGASAPDDHTQLLNNRPLFNWDNTIGATSYLLQFSTRADFKSVMSSRSSKKSIYLSPTNLPIDRTLYWRVIPKFGERKGKASEIWQLQTAAQPSTPKPLSPKLGSIQRTLHPALLWSSAVIPNGRVFGYYEVEVATDSTFLYIVAKEQVAGPVSNRQVTLSTELEQNSRYYWRVRGVSSEGYYGNWSNGAFFRVAPSTPMLIEPANLNYASSLLPVFSWQLVDGVTRYTLQVSMNPSFSNLLFSKSLPKTSITSIKKLRSGRTYYWRVRSYGSNGSSEWSEIWSFTAP